MLTLERFRAIEADFAEARVHHVAACAHATATDSSVVAYSTGMAEHLDLALHHLGNVLRDLDAYLFAHKPPRGAKTVRVESVVNAMPGEFSCAQLSRLCPGVSRELVRQVMRRMKRTGVLICAGRGLGARWRVNQQGREGVVRKGRIK